MSRAPRKAAAFVLVITILLGSIALPRDQHVSPIETSRAALVGDPDFSIVARPNFTTITAGAATTSMITLSSLGGFSGNIVLSESSYVLDASLNETELSLGSAATSNVTLSILAPSNALPGNYTISITGTNGCSLSHNTHVTVTVVGPDLLLSVVKTLLVAAPGGSDTSTIEVASVNGFSGPVNLYASSPVVTATLSPPSVYLTLGAAGTSKVTISVPLGTQPGNYTIELQGVASSLARSLDLVISVNGPGFTLSPSPYSLTATAGGSSNSSVITVNAFGGFVGDVSLTNSSTPGLDAVLSPKTIIFPRTSSTLTLTVMAGTVPGIYSVTVTGSSGAYSQSVDIPVIVQGPDFELSAQPLFLAVAVGGTSCTSTVTLTATNGFSGNIGLKTNPLQPGLDASLLPTSITDSGTSMLTVSAASSIFPGLYLLTINATSTSLSHYATIGVLVTGPDFTLSANPDHLTATPGSSTVSTIMAISLHGFSGTIGLSASALVTGISPSIMPSSLPGGAGSATLSVGVDSSVVPGIYAILVTGVSGSLNHAEFIPVQVAGPDFSISTNTSQLTMSTVGQVASTIVVDSLNGFMGNVSLHAVASLNLNASIAPVSVRNSGTANLSVNSTVPGSYFVIVGGSSGPLFHSILISVTVVGRDFVISAPDHLTVPVGVMGNAAIMVSQSGGFADNVTLTLTSPTGLNCSLSSTLIVNGSGSSNLTCVGSNGTYSVIVTGTSRTAGPHSKTIVFIAADFTLSASAVNPTELLAESPGISNVTLAATSGFSGVVNLSVSQSTPSGLTCTLPMGVTLSSPLETVLLSCVGSGAGDYSVTVTGLTSSPSEEKASILFHVTDFSIAVSPSSMTIAVGSTGSFTVRVTGLNGFSSTVSLAYSASTSAALTCNLSPVGLTGSGTSNLSCTPSTSGTYGIHVTGTSKLLSHNAQTAVNSPPPDFSVSTTPSSNTIQQGSSATTVITVTPIYGFTGNVNLTATVSPSGPSVFLSTSSITGGSGTSTLTINVNGNVAPGTFTVTVQGASGSLLRSANESIIVTSTPGAANILGLPSTTFYLLVVIVSIAALGAGIYFLRLRKKNA